MIESILLVMYVKDMIQSSNVPHIIDMMKCTNTDMVKSTNINMIKQYHNVIDMTKSCRCEPVVGMQHAVTAGKKYLNTLQS